MTDQPKKTGVRLSPTQVMQARRLYETTDLTLTEVAARVGISAPALCKRAQKAGWERSSKELRDQAVRRIRLRVEREISAVETVLAGTGAIGEADRAARTLASLVRTLRELQKYDEDAARMQAAEERDEDGAPADLDAFRDALADRLERLQRENQ